ncbi:MAG: hypothetical protein NVS4B8_10970 [Herpetosiphon sp.]
MGFLHFMASGTGRLVRIVAGGTLLVGGLLLIYGPVPYVVAAIGLKPLAAGLFDFCSFAPLMGFPLRGPAIRKQQ